MNTQTDSLLQRAIRAEWADPDGLRYVAAISIWVRWTLLAVITMQIVYRPMYNYGAYASYVAFYLLAALFNGYVHYRLHTGRDVTWKLLLALSTMDMLFTTIAIAMSGGFPAYFFVLYYPALAVFATAFASFRISFLWVTMVAAGYITVCLAVGDGFNFGAMDEKVVILRVCTMYAVVVLVNLISRFERIRRREAVERVREQERERQLQMERLQLSQVIHDTVAQSAYVLGLGIESAIEAEDPTNEEQVARLKAMHMLSKSTMWELRHPIDIDLIFRGRELGTVLEAHASTFTNITSIPTEVVCSGEEPPLSTVARGLLFAIAHNAMANALRHASAEKVTITLDFRDDALRMSISDDGVGLPSDYAERGRGFTNMEADAEQMGGTLEVSSGESRRGTTVTCVVPYEKALDAS